MLIDDFSDPGLVSRRGTVWRGLSDRVMGGLSEASVARAVVDGRPCLRLTGDVRLDNNGGFVQAALDLAPDQGLLDAGGFAGIAVTARGNDEVYGLHLRTAETTRPWQSYRAQFTAGGAWRSVALPFEGFEPHRIDAPLDLRRLRRIGLVAIGRAFTADLMVAELRLYR